MTCRNLIVLGLLAAILAVLTGCGPTATLPGNTTADNTNTDATTDTGGTTDTADTATPGVLTLKTYTTSLGASAQWAPDDININLTPTAYTLAFKRIVVKDVDRSTNTVRSEVEVFNAPDLAHALIVDLKNAVASDLLSITTLPAGTYNKIDIEVFYLDMTVPTMYPSSEVHDLVYRMIYETMGVVQPRDLLVWVQPEWVTGNASLAAQITKAGWYWMGRPLSGLTVFPAEGAQAHPNVPILDMFYDPTYWDAAHKVLEGGEISPSLVYDPAKGGVVTMAFDLTDTFQFKDYHDATIAADGKWQLLVDSGMHPFPPSFHCDGENNPPEPPKGDDTTTTDQPKDTTGDQTTTTGGK